MLKPTLKHGTSDDEFAWILAALRAGADPAELIRDVASEHRGNLKWARRFVDIISARQWLAEAAPFLPRLDDFSKTQHQITSTRGMLCLAASYRLLYRSDFARMRRKAGSLFVTQWPKTNPPIKTAPPASRLLKRLKVPTAPTQTK
jgi:hypothetical protein